MTSRTDSTGSYSQAYDVENRLINVSKGSGKVGFPAVSPNTTFDNFLVSNAEISRSSYTLGGQAIATRVTGDPTASNNGLFYIFSGHLGSTSVLATSNGSQVAGSKTAYYPFGSPRTTPTQTIIDRNFTGQKENLELGLIYYNARFYLPTTARFLTPDSLIPRPTDPQSFNRYAYTRNNPINRVDPTGHVDCTLLGNDEDSGGCENQINYPPPDPKPTIPTGPMVTFSVTCATCVWTEIEMATIQASAIVTGTRLAETFNYLHPTWNLSAEEAFLLVYGGSINFRKTGESCSTATGYSGCWGKTFLRDGKHEIDVYTDANLAGDVHWAVHEFAHAFVNTGRGHPISTLAMYQDLQPNFPNRPLTPNSELGLWGFAGTRWEWQRSDQGRASEEFADMFLGWVYNQWEVGQNPNDGWSPSGQLRASFMNSYMPFWLNMGY